MDKSHYYKIEIDFCPICGSENKTRTRVYGEKPTEPEKRYAVIERYDYCDAF